MAPLIADLNRDGVVNAADVAAVTGSFGRVSGYIGFVPRADVDGDGAVTAADVALTTRAIGR